MKNSYSAFVLLSVVILSGCETVYNGGRSSSRHQEAQARILQESQQRQQVQRDTEIAKASAQEAGVRLDDVESRLDRVERRAENSAGMSDVTSLRGEVSSLRAELADIRADREKMKKEIVDEISANVAKMLAAKQAAAPRPAAPVASQTGYEHKVQSGQTLSAIAQAYGVSVEKIKQANGLKNDTIKVGQTLFIPD